MGGAGRAVCQHGGVATPETNQVRTVRLRMTRASLLVVGFALVCAVPLATALAPWGLLLLLVPLLGWVWVARTGIDIDPRGVTARRLFGRRLVGWDAIVGIRVGRRGELWLVKTNRTEVRLPTLRTRDLSRLYLLTGRRLGIPPATSPAEPPSAEPPSVDPPSAEPPSADEPPPSAEPQPSADPTDPPSTPRQNPTDST